MECKNLIRSVIGMGLLIALTGCASAQDDPTVTPSPVEPTATVEPTPQVQAAETSTPRVTSEPAATATRVTTSSTPTPTATSAPGPSPTPSMTPTLSSWIEEDFLFSEEQAVENCNLPCWQGLTPGISSADEVDQVFSQVFGYGRVYDTLEAAVADYANKDWPYMKWVGQSWIFDNTISIYMHSNARFSTSAWLDRENYRLNAIRFRWTGVGLLSNYTPAKFIKELGQPTLFLMSISDPDYGIPPIWSYGVILVYEEQGLIYLAGVTDPDAPDDGVNVCFDGENWSGLYDGGERVVYLTLVSGESFPTPEQEFLLQNWTNVNQHKPIQEVLGVSIEEVTQQIQSGGSTCWWYSEN